MRDDLALSRGLGSWQVLVADEETAAAQMMFDEALARRGRPTLRLFRWAAPAISLGFRQVPPEWADEERLAAHGVARVERPTGGGIAVHGSDLSCSVTVPVDARLPRDMRSMSGTESPKSLRDFWGPLRELMAGVCESLSQAIRAFGVAAAWQADVERPARPARIGAGGDRRPPSRLALRSGGRCEASAKQGRIDYCLTEASPYAIMAGSQKVCGLAIRRYPEAWLIQGSLLVRPLPAVFERLMPPAVREAFATRAVSLQEAAGRAVEDTELIGSIVSSFGLRVSGFKDMIDSQLVTCNS